MASTIAQELSEESVVAARDRDPFTMEVIKNALVSVADEMALTVARTARSFVVKEALDYSTALFTADGELIAQGTCLPLHLGSMPAAIQATLAAFGDDMSPGDMFIMNDPYDGSTHLPDVVIVKPIFLDGQRVGYSTTLAHQTDIGGRVPGGNACDSTEIYQEGLRIPPVRLYTKGEPEDFMFRIIERNVRVPDKVLGDIRSQIAACLIGERGYLGLIETYGLEGFEAHCRELLDYTERFTRAEIEKLPDGEYEFTDYIDNDGIEPGTIRFHVKLTIRGDSIVVDFDGSASQVKGAINSVLTFTRSCAWTCVRAVLDISIPNNAGYFRPIEVTAPEGTIVNPRPPAPVAARGLSGFRIADTVFGALAQVAPDKVPASGSSAPDAGISFGGYYPDGSPFVYLEFNVGSWGGGPDRDGMDACTGVIVNYSNTPVELLETEQPLQIERYAFIPDSGGAGRYRGGLAMERHIRCLADDAVVQLRSDRRDVPPYGLEGGGTGAPSRIRLARAGSEDEDYPSKFLTTINAGDLLKISLAGGGGYGDPLEREAQDVCRDVVERKMSREHASAQYGVVLAGEPPEVGGSETEALRERMRAAREP